jgi:nucleoside-triphosphatase THEP1
MKNNANNIYILTGPVRSGKTTQLQQWLATGIQAAGILTPDVKGVRMLYDIALGKYHAFEVDETYGAEKVSIGRFLFARNTFNQGREILARPLLPQTEWMVIDEVGKLEVEQGEGWEPMVLRLVAGYKADVYKRNLLLVIRDSLLEKTLYKYDLEGRALIIHQLPV